MMVPKLACLPTVARASLAICYAIAASFTAAAEPAAPSISERHKLHLARIVQRTLRDTVAGRNDYEPSYVPPALQQQRLEMVVRLRSNGYLVATGIGGPGPTVDATVEAARQAAALAVSHGTIGKDHLGDVLIEMEAVGDPVPIEFDGDWTKPRAVDPFIEPGVHGMVVAGPRGRHRFCPTEVFTNDVVLSDALTELAQHTHGDSSQVISGSLMKFRTTHWYLDPNGDDIVSLSRGLSIVPRDAVSREGLDEAIDRLGSYMVYRQQPGGLFTYQYEPGLDRYTDDDNAVRQAGATLGIATLAKVTGKSAPLGAADLAIRVHLQGRTVISDVEGAAFIATSDGRHKLGTTALLCLALAAHPEPERFAATRQELVRGMLWLQRPSGMFITAFPPAEQFTGQDYFPGEALLALAVEYERHPTAEVLEAFDRAIQFYRGYFRDRPSPAFVPWQVQAYCIMARQTKRADYRDFVFELTDWLAAVQLSEDNCKWPEMWGGIASYQKGRAGVSTASYLEGFADALTLAKQLKDEVRVKRYAQLVRRAARFVLQLQFRPEEAYFVRSPKDAVWGIRTTPSLNHLRIDHCQHALIALIKSRAALFPTG